MERKLFFVKGVSGIYKFDRFWVYCFVYEYFFWIVLFLKLNVRVILFFLIKIEIIDLKILNKIFYKEKYISLIFIVEFSSVFFKLIKIKLNLSLGYSNLIIILIIFFFRIVSKLSY